MRQVDTVIEGAPEGSINNVEDLALFDRLGIKQELDRQLSGFSNFALSFSIICILAGGISSFHLGFCSIGGAALGIGWPVACLVSLIVAATMGQLASSFPTAGGLYHWSLILGGRGFGWTTAWLNLAGLVTILAAINVGTFLFVIGILTSYTTFNWSNLPIFEQILWQSIFVIMVTGSQALGNLFGMRWTRRLTDFSGYLILGIALLLTISLLICAPSYEFERLWGFSNFSGSKGGDVWPYSESVAYLFFLALLLPAYTITGFDASAHASEETLSARSNVPRGIVRSVLISSIAGWIMVCAIVIAIPNVQSGARQGSHIFFWVLSSTLPSWLGLILLGGIVLAQYLCGLATVTSASRMMFAFSRDGGLPFSNKLSLVHKKNRVPTRCIWTVAILATLFTMYVPIYNTITVVCSIFLYLSYVLPSALGFFRHGRTWTEFGPWTLGRWYKPAALISVLGCIILIWIGIQPPNDQAFSVLMATFAIMLVVWFFFERHRYQIDTYRQN